MKLKLWNIFLILILFFGCQKDRILDGNYSLCSNGEYSEVYFKKDSIRAASESKWVRLAGWRKMEIKNDTLYFRSFGHLTDDYIVKIKHIGINKVELHNLVTDSEFELESFNANMNFENTKEFWIEFKKRRNSSNCE
jgi:hypothetical protein